MLGGRLLESGALHERSVRHFYQTSRKRCGKVGPWWMVMEGFVLYRSIARLCAEPSIVVNAGLDHSQRGRWYPDKASGSFSHFGVSSVLEAIFEILTFRTTWELGAVSIKGGMLLAASLTLFIPAAPRQRESLGRALHWCGRAICGISIMECLCFEREDHAFTIAVLSTMMTGILSNPILSEKVALLACLIMPRLWITFVNLGIGTDEQWIDKVKEAMMYLSALLILCFTAPALILVLHAKGENDWMRSLLAATFEEDQFLPARSRSRSPDRQKGCNSPPIKGGAEMYDDYFTMDEWKQVRVQTESEKSTSEARKKQVSVKRRLAEFKRLSVVSMGAQGVVEEVTELQSQRTYALKIGRAGISAAGSTYAEGVEFEAQALAGLEHPNIVAFVCSVQTPEGPGIILEMCGQTDLCMVLHKVKTLAEPAVALVTKQLVTGLDYLHRHDICHRDIKPSNIMIRNRSVKIVDFGSAFVPGIRQKQALHGTPNYMAPEQVAGRSRTRKSDVWSVGAVVMESLTRMVPLDLLEKQNESQMGDINLLQKLGSLEDGLDLPEKLGPEAKDFVATCLIPLPDKRPTARTLLTHAFLTRLDEGDGSITSHGHLAESQLLAAVSMTGNQEISEGKEEDFLLLNSPHEDHKDENKATYRWTAMFPLVFLKKMESVYSNQKLEQKFHKMFQQQRTATLSYMFIWVLPVAEMNICSHAYQLWTSGQHTLGALRLMCSVLPPIMYYAACSRRAQLTESIGVFVAFVIIPLGVWAMPHNGSLHNLACGMATWTLYYVCSFSWLLCTALMSGFVVSRISIATIHHFRMQELSVPDLGQEITIILMAAILGGYVFLVLRLEERRKFVATVERRGQ